MSTLEVDTIIDSAGTGAPNFSLGLKTPNIAEVDTIAATAATGVIDYDVTTQSVLFYTTDASGNWTLNLRGSSGTSLDTLMATGECLSVTFLVTQGAITNKRQCKLSGLLYLCNTEDRRCHIRCIGFTNAVCIKDN
jgi:hypothetical protein